jgi:hypothetical protein
MTVWFNLDGIDFAVTGERVKGYVKQLDRFEVKSVYVRSPSQNIKVALGEGFATRIRAAALKTAQNPVPIPYDVKGA